MHIFYNTQKPTISEQSGVTIFLSRSDWDLYQMFRKSKRICYIESKADCFKHLEKFGIIYKDGDCYKLGEDYD